MLGKLFAKLMGSKEEKKPATQKKQPTKKRKLASQKKKPSTRGPEKEIGRVVAFFRIPVVAVVRVTRGTLKPGDRIWIRGHTTDLKQVVTSIQLNHQPISEAKKGAEVGVRVSSRARRGDRVYRITP